MTIAIIITLIVLFIITWIVIAVNSTQSLPPCCLRCLHNDCRCLQFSPYCCDHYGIGSLRRENENLRRENLELQSKLLYEIRKESTVYAKSVKEQEYVDIITRGQKTAEQLLKDLKIEIE